MRGSLRRVAGLLAYSGYITLFVTVVSVTCANAVHRSALDPNEPIETSSYLLAGGYPLPWFVREVPPELAAVPTWRRLLPAGFALDFAILFVPVLFLVLLGHFGALAFARLRRRE